MSTLVPLLYHHGNKVTVKRYYMVAVVLKAVKVGDYYLCPHCGYQSRLSAGYGSHYAYFLDTPHPNASCCTPFKYNDLLRYHDVNEHSCESYVRYLKKRSRR